MKHRLPDDIAGVSIYVEDPEIRDDPKQAWLYFRERCRIAHVLEDNKRVLKEKYTEAKACGEKVNATRKAIAYLKQSIEAIRRERAIEGVVNEDDLQKADPEEQRKIDAIAQEKEVYKQNFESLRRLKTEIEHVQRMLESGRKKLQKEYDEWYAHVPRAGAQQAGPGVGDTASVCLRAVAAERGGRQRGRRVRAEIWARLSFRNAVASMASRA